MAKRVGCVVKLSEVIQVFFTSLWYVLFFAIPLYIYFIKIVFSHILSFSIPKKYLLIIGIFIYCLLIYHGVFQELKG